MRNLAITCLLLFSACSGGKDDDDEPSGPSCDCSCTCGDDYGSVETSCDGEDCCDDECIDACGEDEVYGTSSVCVG